MKSSNKRQQQPTSYSAIATALVKATPINPSDDVFFRMKTGALLFKCKPDGTKYPRQFYLYNSEDMLSYHESGKLFGKPNVYLIKEIDEIRCGYHSNTFKRLLSKRRVNDSDEMFAFTIMYDNHQHALDLMARDQITRDTWINGLQLLMERYSRSGVAKFINTDNWILNQFRIADKDDSGSLTKQECQSLLTDVLNTKMPNRLFQLMFKEADISKEGLLNPEEFLQFFKSLTRRQDLYKIMQQHVKDGDSMSLDSIKMNAQELSHFLIHTQGESDMASDRALKLIEQSEMDEKLRAQGLLSVD
ncbi:unnamed protein product, partial [Didymodactylos carnosus]